jgi:hypothetical protein
MLPVPTGYDVDAQSEGPMTRSKSQNRWAKNLERRPTLWVLNDIMYDSRSSDESIDSKVFT